MASQFYQTLSQNDVETIHENSLKILETVGVIFNNERALELWKKAGATVDGKKVFIPRKLVEEQVKTCPSEFTVYGRSDEYNVTFNTTDQVFIGPNCPPFVQDEDNGRRRGTLEDFNNLTKLMQQLDNVDMQAQIHCEPDDTDLRTRHLEMSYSSLRYSMKPFMASSAGYERACEDLEFVAIAHGGVDEIKRHPATVSIPCAVTPLDWNEEMTGGLIAGAEYSQPMCINSLPIAGATAPVTLAGTLAVQNAEILAGIVLSQLVNPGCPVIYSAAGAAGDMGSGNLALGSPEDAIFSLATSQLAKYYNIPCRQSGAICDSQTPDAQAGYESMMNLMTSVMAGGNYILHACGILDSFNTVSFEKMVIDNEMIGMVKRIVRGVDMDEESQAMDVIAEAGPQGEFISCDHTFDNFRDCLYMPTLSWRGSFPRWQEKGAQDTLARANAKWKKLLEDYEEPTLDPDVDRDLRAFIENAR